MIDRGAFTQFADDVGWYISDGEIRHALLTGIHNDSISERDSLSVKSCTLTDAYLLALAVRSQVGLVTLDGSIPRLRCPAQAVIT
jgi:hypothetical protein